MAPWKKRDPERDKGGNLFEEVYGKLTEQEIAELENDAEKRAAFEEAKLRAKRKQRARFIGTVVLLVVITLAVAFVGYKVLFNITELEVKGDSPYTAEEIFAAAEVSVGDGLYSFSSGGAEERVKAALPYVKSLKVQRHIPDGITFEIETESAVYYAEIYGKIYLMSDSLRILGEAGDADLSSLVWLRLSHVRESKAGFLPVMRDKTAQKYLESIVSSVNKSVLAGRITQIDLRDIYDLNMVCDNKFLLAMGEYDEVDTKLRVAEGVLRDPMFEGNNKARLDLSELSKTTVIVNNKLDFTK